ncbi:glycoside hydrolase [Salmonella enterica subsp. diarizonae]|uniref:Glycoside hydrolase n=1 Tax=Salmonella diarizonae TaxID=59204 RepID=A0A8F5RH94_SALDZ|nr:glycoside hydrolase [Salmonella enterica subsp. diarizonae]
MGQPFQNGEINATYNPVNGRIYVYFTSCKGLTGWGYSQAGTTDPDHSSQIYFTYSDGEAFNWIDPINITSKLKAQEDEFSWISPCRSVVFPSGRLGLVSSSVIGSVVKSYFVIIDNDIVYLKNHILTSEYTGGEVGVHLLDNGKVVVHSRAYASSDGNGLQKIYISNSTFDQWNFISSVVTSDVKGDLVKLSNGYDNNPLWALTCANGRSDSSVGRSDYRVWFSRDLKKWDKSPITGINTDSVGYISSTDDGDGDGIISSSESGSFIGIWFTYVSQNYIRGRTYSLNGNKLKEVYNTYSDNALSSGAINNYELYINKSNESLCINYNGSGKKILQFGVNDSSTFVLDSSFTGNSVNVDNIDIIYLGAGNFTLSGLTG